MLVMEEHTAQSGLNKHRNARRFDLALSVVLNLAWAQCAFAEPKRFELPAGDAGVMLIRFGQQSDIQLLFNFTQLTGKKTNAVIGTFEPVDALRTLLRGVPVQWTFVNSHTLALTVTAEEKPPAQTVPRARRWWQRLVAKPARPTADGLDQVLIAGSNTLNEAPPIGVSLIRLDRLDIERSGFATTQDFIHTLPQVFGGGPSEDTQLGREAVTNTSKGSGINLRGLDAGATLVLIDGQRTAPSGGQGLFSDISNIPLSAIDHIDIMPDGASARYGADAIGGVANFVLRSNFYGAETQLRDGNFSSDSLGGRQFSQLFGTRWNAGTGMIGFEYYDRNALPSSSRLQATSDLRSFGGSNFDTPYGSPGTIAVGQQTWAVPPGQNGRALAATDLRAGTQNLYDRWTGATVVPQQARWSAFGTLRSEVDDGVQLFADSLFTSRTTTNTSTGASPRTLAVPPSNPFYVNPAGGGDPVTVLYGTRAEFGPPTETNRIRTGNMSLGLTAHLSPLWSATGQIGYALENEDSAIRGLADPVALEAALADSDPATAFNPFGDGSNTNPTTLAKIASVGLFTSRSSVKMAGVNVDGTIFHTSGGDARLTIGAEHRHQSFDTSTLLRNETPLAGQSSNPVQAVLSRNISAAFADLQLPLVGESNSQRFLHRLELSIGGRWERYSDVGAASVPRVGLLWSPGADVALRGTWTKSFRPPVLMDVVENNSFSDVIALPDSKSPTGTTTALVVGGTNPNLREERARTWTVGAEITPHSLPGVSVALTYFATYYSQRIEEVQIGPDVLDHPELGWLVNRDFTAAARSEICSQTLYEGVPTDCLGIPIGAIVDNRIRNVEHLQTRGIDLIGKYVFATSLGSFSAGLNGSYLLDYSEAKTPGSPTVDLLNTQNNPINLRFRGSLSWDRRGFGVSTYVNFDNGYRDVSSEPNRSVRSWTTFDLQLRYRTPRENLGFLGNTEFAVSAQNLFNSSPPFVNNPVGVGYDQENADLTGRIVAMSLIKRW